MDTNNILDKIQQIREKNNKNWLDILKLAFRLDPYNAKKIMQKIVECDEKIKDLCKELIE